MIKEVKKMKEGRYLLNNSVIISDFDFGDKGVSYKLDWDEQLVSEEDAKIMGNEFVHRAVTSE